MWGIWEMLFLLRKTHQTKNYVGSGVSFLHDSKRRTRKFVHQLEIMHLVEIQTRTAFLSFKILLYMKNRNRTSVAQSFLVHLARFGELTTLQPLKFDFRSLC